MNVCKKILLSNVRNFFLTFVISLIIFGIIAFFVVGLVLDSINVSVSGVDTSPIVHGSDNYIESTIPDKQAELDGISFNMLLYFNLGNVMIMAGGQVGIWGNSLKCNIPKDK